MSNNTTINFDAFGNTLTMWWGKPDEETYSEESANGEDIMMVNKKGQVVGLEKLNFFPKEMDPIKYLKGDLKGILDVFFLRAGDKKIISS